MNSNIINELFNAPVEWKWTSTGKNRAFADFKVDNQQYQFQAVRSHFNWSIDFANMSVDTNKKFDITNTGKSSIVFATIIDILKDFKKTYSPTEIVFIADEDNRSQLYKRIAKSIFPEYKISDNGIYIILNLKKESINELFDAPAKWKWIQFDEDEAEATFTVGDNEYVFNAHIPNSGYWKISFINTTVDHDIRYKITNTGNSSSVFSTVLDIVKDFKKKYNPELIYFSADEPNRKQLYKRIAKTVFPEYDITDKGVYIEAKKRDKNLSESEINRADVKAILKGASDLRNTPSRASHIFKGLKKDKIDINDLQQAWKDDGFPDDTRDIYSILQKKFGFGDKEIKKVFAQVFGDHDAGDYEEPIASPAIQKIADYAKNNGFADQLIEFMKDEFGEELGLVKSPGMISKAIDAGKKLYKKAVAEEVRQIFTAIIQEERINRSDLIRQQEQISLGRTKK